MKEAVISAGPKVQIIDSPIPTPGPGQILIKVVCSGSNPKDWKFPEWMPDKHPFNQGDDVAGFVHGVGEGVEEFKKGDRVASFHEIMTPGGSYAEYALGWAYTTFHLPEKTSFVEGAAIPLAAMTAALGLYARLGLPQPWLPIPDGKKTPLVIYGASSAVGSYAIQLARRSNIHPLICVAGRASAHVEGLIDRNKGDIVIDYRLGDDEVATRIQQGLKGARLMHAFDAVAEKGSWQCIARVLDPHGAITLVTPQDHYEGLPASVTALPTIVNESHGPMKEFAFVFFRYFAKGLAEGWFRPQPQQIVPGGLAGVETALKDLKDGKASAVKYIFQIEDTP